MREWELAEPLAGALVESLRALGYSPETAVADLIDNSISAGARTIDVDFFWNGAASQVSVRDDGAGMSETELVAAMRPGSASPLEQRGARDLGRFGLGLKTASFSQAREFTVQTRTGPDAPLAVRRWDLDTIAQTGEWRLLRTIPDGVARVERLEPGTTVTWTKCDRLVGTSPASDAAAQRHFNETVRRVGEHLSEVFHRFMSGPGKITFRLNGRELAPWDPFMERHDFTQTLSPEELPFRGSRVTVTPFVLPHSSKLTPDERTETKGWNHRQGFYIYRGNRLLVKGNWLGLGFTKDEHTKLARLRIDFPTSLDADWQVDVKKSSATAPAPLRNDLRRIARATRRLAEDVYRHRGKVVARMASAEYVTVWQQVKSREGNTVYRVNRKHPAVVALLQNQSTPQELERVLRLLEETIPTNMIGIAISEAHDVESIPYAESRSDLLPLLDLLYTSLLEDGNSEEDALVRAATTEPFTTYPEVIQQYREKLWPP